MPPANSLTEEDVRRLLDPGKLLQAIETAFRDRYSSIAIPERVSVPLGDGTFLAMSCYDRSGHTLGIKLVKVRSHPAANQDSVHATYLLLDPETAEPRLAVAANYLTDLRTAATSAVATKFLAREDASTLGIFGTGRLARTHLQMIPRVRRIQRVLVSGRTPAQSARFVEHLASDYPQLALSAADPRTCAAEADILCTCTTSPAPLFDGRDLKAGAHLNLTGVFQSNRREVDSDTIRCARVVIDTEEALSAGDLLIPKTEGTISPAHIVATLHELLSRKKKGRVSSADITVFKSVGCALEDLVSAELLLAAQAE